MRATLLPILLLAGCPPFIWGGAPEGGTGDGQNVADPRDDTGTFVEPTDDTSDPGHDTEPSTDLYHHPTWFAAQFTFGYDAETQELVAVWYERPDIVDTLTPRMDLILFDDDAQSVLCTISLRHDSASLPTTAALSGDFRDDTISVGALFDRESTLVSSDCEGVLDPAVWGEDYGDLFTRAFGAGLTGAQSSTDQGNTQNWAEAAGVSYEDLQPFAVGSRGYIEGLGTLTSGGSELFFGMGEGANRDDPDGPLVVQWLDQDTNEEWDVGEPSIYIPKEEIEGGTPPSGYYSLRSLVPLSVGQPLEDFLSP